MSTTAYRAGAQCALVCISQVQVSIDSSSCTAMVSPGVLLQDSSQCDMGNFGVELRTLAGDILPSSPRVSINDLGTIEGVVYDSVSGNSCWSTIVVEYKFGPNISCENDTIDCFESVTFTPPVSSSGCLPANSFDIVIVNETREEIDCDPDFVRRRTVTWRATDDNGRSSECTQELLVTRFDSALLEFPENRTELTNNPLLCTEDYDLDNDGVLDWQLVGFPTYDGDTLAPGNYPDCRIDVEFEDIPLGGNSCKQKLIRRWRVWEWFCATSGSGSIVYEQNQLIDIVDTVGPTITCPSDLTVTTTPGDCDARLNLPPASADGSCSAISRYDVSIPSAGVFLQNQNGGLVDLPAGIHRVTYRATNDCSLSDTCSILVTVQDHTPPVAVCDQNTVVSLTNTGTGKAHASTFDDGSHDECGIDRIEVRRMDATCGLDTEFGDYVHFNCCDVDNGPVMVVLRVYDNAGNWNECMTSVEVQDKLRPTISCPDDITVTCTYPFSFDDLSVFGDIEVLDSATQLNDPLLDPRDSIIIDDPDRVGYVGPSFRGLDGYALGSCNITITETVDTTNFDNCGQGTILRRFTATNSSGESVSCVQSIRVINPRPFTEDDIRWPQREVTIEGACGGDTDPSVTGEPTWNQLPCRVIGLNGPNDETFVIDDPNDPSCFKILRTWRVIDWCTYDNSTGAGVWSYTQVIKVIDTEGPTITSCDDVSICSTDPDCADAAINISISAEDECTDFDGLSFSYVIDAFSDGTFDFSNTNNPLANPGNAKNEASGNYPIGTHTIIWTVTDPCGSFTTCSAEFRIDNCTAPKPYCLNGLAASLMPMDTDGDGTNDWGMIDIWASDFDAASEHPCYDTVYLSFSPDTSDRVRTFTCDSIGRRLVQVWVTAPNGEQSFCHTFIDIQDNNNVCPAGSGTSTLANITGDVSTGYNDFVEEVEVALIGGETTDMTDAQGHYDFSNMPTGGSYVVSPHKEDHYLNGITANDLSLIQRHVLGVTPFEHAYQYYAADANNDDVVDIRDVHVLRRLLLGLDSELAELEPWIFYDASCVFNSDNPLQEACASDYQIPSFNDHMTVDFTAVKVGDLDNDVELDFMLGATGRTARNVTLQTTDIDLRAGEQYDIVLNTAEATNLSALQMTLAILPGSATLDGITSVGLASAAFNTRFADRGMVSVVWSESAVHEFTADQGLITVTITAQQDAKLSEIMDISSTLTDAIGFDADGRLGVTMNFETRESVASTPAADFELYQNAPNPFADFTTIAFVLPKAGDVNFMVADVNGRVIMQRTAHYEAGMNEIRVAKDQLNASGLLYYRVSTDDHAATKKMIILD